MLVDYDELHTLIEQAQAKYSLVDFNFDTECIYQLGDLSALLEAIVAKTLPEKGIHITEQLALNEQHYVATLASAEASATFTANTCSDWLPDYFFDDLENLPFIFSSEKRFYSINPAIGLTGQDAWYFCGTEAQLKAARQEGLPLVFPGENIFETPEYKHYGSSGQVT